MYKNESYDYCFQRITSFLADDQFPDGHSLLQKHADLWLFGSWGNLDVPRMTTAHNWPCSTHAYITMFCLYFWSVVQRLEIHSTSESSPSCEWVWQSFNSSCTLLFANLWRPLQIALCGPTKHVDTRVGVVEEECVFFVYLLLLLNFTRETLDSMST